VPHGFVLTKADKLKQSKKAAANKTFKQALETDEDHPMISYSAVTAEGKRELWSLIDRRIAEASRRPNQPLSGESLETV